MTQVFDMKKSDDENVQQASEVVIPTPEVFATMSKDSLRILQERIGNQIDVFNQRIKDMVIDLREDANKIGDLKNRVIILQEYLKEGVPQNPDPRVKKDLANNTGVYNALEKLFDEGKKIEKTYLETYSNRKSTIDDMKETVKTLQNESHQILMATTRHNKYNPTLTSVEQISVRESVQDKLNSSLKSTIQESVRGYEKEIPLSRDRKKTELQQKALNNDFKELLQQDAKELAQKIAFEVNGYDANKINNFCKIESAKTQQAIAYLDSYLENNSHKLKDKTYQTLYQDLVRLNVKSNMINSANKTGNNIIKDENPANILSRAEEIMRDFEKRYQNLENEHNKDPSINKKETVSPAADVKSSGNASRMSNKNQEKQIEIQPKEKTRSSSLIIQGAKSEQKKKESSSVLSRIPKMFRPTIQKRNQEKAEKKEDQKARKETTRKSFGK